MPVTIKNIRLIMSELCKRLMGEGVGAVLARGASGSLIVMVIGAAMAFGTNILLARLMGVTQYGVYIYALTVINLLALVCKLGMDNSLLRFIAAYNAKSEWGLFRGILGFSIKYVLIASITIGVLAGAIVCYLDDSLGPDQARTFLVALLLLPVLVLTALRGAALRSLKHVVKSSLPESFFRPLIIVLLASVFYLLYQDELSASQVMMFNLIGLLVAFSIGTVWLYKHLPSQLRDTAPDYRQKEWIKVSMPLFFMSAMSLVLHQTDIIMIGIMLDADQVGIYAVASRVARLVSFGLVAVNAIAVPLISELYSTGKHKQLQRMITLSARGIFVITLLACGILVVYGDFVLGLFGEEFIVAYMPLLYLLGGLSVNALAGSVGFLMTMTGHQNQAAVIVAVSALINVTLNLILISRMGILGAALATAVTFVIRNCIMLVYVWRELNINPTVLARI